MSLLARDERQRVNAEIPRANARSLSPRAHRFAYGTGTPRSWRVAAAALLVVPAMLGSLLSRRRRGAWFTAVLAATTPPLLAAHVIRASRTEFLSGRQPGLPRTGPGSVTVIVTARNEAAVIANLVADLGAQDILQCDPPAAFEVFIIDDRSTDGTGDAAMRAASGAGIANLMRVVRREEVHGVLELKSAALASVPPAMCSGDVVVHLDADGRVGPRFLSTVLAWYAAGVVAMTARRCVLPRPGSLAGAQADEIAADGALLEGRWAAGGLSDFRGNGAVISRELLEAVGGWPSAVTEDIELATRIAVARGVSVAYARDAVVWEEPVLSFGALWRQRVRWAEGAIRRSFRYGPELVSDRTASPGLRVDLALYSAQLALPMVILGSIAVPGRRAPVVAAGTLAGYGVFQGLLAWHGLRDEPAWAERGGPTRPPPALTRAARSIRAAIFQAIWLGTVPHASALIVFRRGPIRFWKTTHRDSSWTGRG